MPRGERLDTSLALPVVRIDNGVLSESMSSVATEVPLTIIANDIEIATLLATPSALKELTYGYLFTSGFIHAPADVREFFCDTERWAVQVKLASPPDPDLARRRLYTAGCGTCAMYTTTVEIAMRRPVSTAISVGAAMIVEAARWIDDCSALFIQTGGVHTAGLVSTDLSHRLCCEDIARHNAVDKVIGMALLQDLDTSGMILVRTGRTSSEIVFKARRCGIAITVSRGAPTHQAVLLAADMGLTIVGFARGGSCTIYSHSQRITP